ncbi:MULTISPECIES: hypothetical protein [Actinomycetes]|uniref:hypothetical protein n=1 Tax=Actinomycetes TaxID=1760 RepID=UPI0036686DE4
MSTMRRPLGTGPSTTKSTPTDAPAPRLLPVERADVVERLDVDEHQDDDGGRDGRRPLGTGVETPGARR